MLMSFQINTHMSENANERMTAHRTFEKLYRAGQVKRVGAALSGHKRALQYRPNAASHDGAYTGVQAVAINQIVGSENRLRDFDCDFLPLTDHLEERWVGVAVAYLTGKTLPPVELIKVGNAYYVRDGHHRISVARAFGQQTIDAVVTAYSEAA